LITFTIDTLTPCLRNVHTGDIVETEVMRIRRKSFLSKFNEKTGWYVNWSKFPSEVEIYALVIKGTVDIQGLIALTNDNDSNAVYINWACTSPNNNIWRNGVKDYDGVGGHLFAVAINKSLEYGHGGCIHAIAMDEDIMNHYKKQFGANIIGILHPYHFVIDEKVAEKIMEVYDYGWSDDEL
jgi:hypothetical protein